MKDKKEDKEQTEKEKIDIEDASENVETETGQEDSISVEQLEKLKAKADERDKFFAIAQQTTADMENLRKRTVTQIQDAHKFGTTNIIEQLLTVLDNFELAMNPEHRSDPEAFLSGIEQVQRMLASVLDKSGLKKIESVGLEFDPEYHEAIMTESTEDDEKDNTVSKELRAGYMLHNRVLRAAQVIVAKKQS